jgi:hypothetical protein
MKISFDKEIFDYLINDLCMLFKEKGDIIDQNQVIVNNIVKYNKRDSRDKGSNRYFM